MTQKNRQSQLMSAGIEASDALCGGSLDPVVASGATLQSDDAMAVRKAVINLDEFVLNLEADDDYIGAKIADMPDSNLLYLGVEVSLELVKGGVTNGLVAATDITMAIGTVVASNSTLSATMQDLVELDALTATDSSPEWLAHSSDQSTIPMPYRRLDAATNAIYLNLAASVTVDDTLTCSGTVTVYYIDLGNVGS